MKNSITLLYQHPLDAKKIIQRLSEKIKPAQRALGFKKKVQDKKANIILVTGFIFILLHIIAGLIYFLCLFSALYLI